jgi:hypothetical protein
MPVPAPTLPQSSSIHKSKGEINTILCRLFIFRLSALKRSLRDLFACIVLISKFSSSLKEARVKWFDLDICFAE